MPGDCLIDLGCRSCRVVPHLSRVPATERVPGKSFPRSIRPVYAAAPRSATTGAESHSLFLAETRMLGSRQTTHADDTCRRHEPRPMSVRPHDVAQDAD